MWDVYNTGVNRVVNAISNVLGNSASDAKVRLVMRSMPKEAVLNKTPEQLIQQYGKGVKWDNNAVELLKDRVNTFKYDILNAVSKRPEMNKITPYAELVTYGTPTVQETRNKLTVLSEVLSGNATIEDPDVSIKNGVINFIDDNGKKVTGRILMNDTNAKEVNINDLNNNMVTRLITNKPSDGVQRSAVTLKVEVLDSDNKPHIYNPKIHVSTSDIGDVSKDADISSLNNLSVPMSKGSNSAYKTGIHLFSEKGHAIKDDNNKPMESHEQALLEYIERANSQGLKLGSYQFNVQGGDKTIVVNPNSDNTMTYKIYQNIKDANGVIKQQILRSMTPPGKYTAVGNLHTIMGLEFDANGINADVREGIYNNINSIRYK